MGSNSPIIPTPFSYITSLMNPNTWQSNPHSLCAKIERRLADCFEAYGKGPKGKKNCADLFYDYHECSTTTFQNLRYKAIRKERMKQYREGKLEKPFEEHPPIDGMILY